MTFPTGIDDIELHVFGPGYGEGLLIHVGQGDWIVVDSCVDTAGQPSALKWLRRVGVDPATAVKVVVATHWRNDYPFRNRVVREWRRSIAKERGAHNIAND